MIYLVRHGKTDWNIEKRTQGHRDILLNDVGRKQAQMLADKIEKLNVNKIITSDLSRAKETAEIINKKIKVPLATDERIRELDYGKLEGIKSDSLSDETWNLFSTNPEKFNAESKEHLYNRIKNFFDELYNIKENILIVTHCVVIRMTMYYAENREEFDNNKYMKNFNSMNISNSDILELKI